MNIWKDEMKCMSELKKTIYKSPLPRKKQRVMARAELPGKVKRFSEEQIFLFKIRRYTKALFN